MTQLYSPTDAITTRLKRYREKGSKTLKTSLNQATNGCEQAHAIEGNIKKKDRNNDLQSL